MVEGTGEDTCASLRCKYHQSPSPSDPQVDFDDSRSHKRSRTVKQIPALRAFELPFVYQEAGERKEALVKVKLCRKCEGKLTWKPGKEIRSDAEGSEDEVRTRRDGDGSSRGRDGREDRRSMSRKEYRSPPDSSRHRKRPSSTSPDRKERLRSRSPDRRSDRVLV